MNKGLVALAIGAFALGMSEFGMMGILSDVARGLDVSIVKAGHFISAYSLGVAIGAPALVVFYRQPLRRLLLILVSVMVIGNTFAALSAGYWSLLAARFISGLPHGAYFGLASIVCSKIADPGKGARAIAVMVGGMTVANLIGVPGATFISTNFHWRLTFAIVALSALAAFIAIRTFVPVLSPVASSSVKGQFAFLQNRAPWLIYAGVFFGQASVYCYFSYIEPIMTQVTGYSMQSMTWIMVVAGLGMVVGNAISGKLADRYGAARISCCIAACLMIVMPALYFTVDNKLAAVLLTFVATAGLFGIGGPLQFLIVRHAKGGEMLGGAGIQIAFNVSNAVSAALGGMAIHHGLGLASPALLGAPFALIGALALLPLARLKAADE